MFWKDKLSIQGSRRKEENHLHLRIKFTKWSLNNLKYLTFIKPQGNLLISVFTFNIIRWATHSDIGVRHNRHPEYKASFLPKASKKIILFIFNLILFNIFRIYFYAISTQHTFLIININLAELNLKMSEKETPGDGSCLFHAILDQIQSIPELQDFASNHFELRWKIVSDGYKMFLESRRLQTWGWVVEGTVQKRQWEGEQWNHG